MENLENLINELREMVNWGEGAAVDLSWYRKTEDTDWFLEEIKEGEVLEDEVLCNF